MSTRFKWPDLGHSSSCPCRRGQYSAVRKYGNYQVDVARAIMYIASELKGSPTWPAAKSTFATRFPTTTTPRANTWKPCCGRRVRFARVVASWAIASRRWPARALRPGVYNCKDCRKPFTVTVGTVMERSHIPLSKWVLATRLMAASKKGMSAHQLHRMLDTSYEAAWFLFHRLREAAADPAPAPARRREQGG